MSNLSFQGVNAKCEGCPALMKPLPRHTILDYEFEDPCDILFISDSPKLMEGSYEAFRFHETKLILRETQSFPEEWKVGFTTAVKCPSITLDTLSAGIRKACKAHLHDSIDHYQPKLVFACGSVATNMLYGRSKESSKIRGKTDVMTTDNGHEFKVVPIIHPFQVVAEPRNAYLFSKDIQVAIKNELLGMSSEAHTPYTLALSIEDLGKCKDEFIATTMDVAVDLETTGLDFLNDTIHTVSLTLIDRETGDLGRTLVLPIDHREAKLGYKIKGEFMKFICDVLANKKNRKVLQNANFDLKFLKRYGVEDIQNVFDTKILQHFLNENIPKSLADLAKYYFPHETF